MRLRMLSTALLIVGLAIGLTLFFGCTQQDQQAAMPDDAPPQEMPADETTDDTPIDEEHMGEHADEMGEHHEDISHHGEMPDVDEGDLELSGSMEDGVRVVEMTAERYTFTPEPLVLKKGQPARLLITSTDVTHGFAIDEMGIDVTLPPNETQIVELTPEEAGEYHFHCSHYCGPGHDEMHGTLVVKE